MTLPAMQLVGNTQRRSFTLGQLAASSASCAATRRQLLQPQALPEVVYGLTSLEVDRQRRGNPRMAYTAALPDEGAMGNG